MLRLVVAVDFQKSIVCDRIDAKEVRHGG